MDMASSYCWAREPLLSSLRIIQASLLTCRDKMAPPWLYRVLSVYLCWCSNPTEWELRCGVPCVVVPIQPKELSCGVPHVDVPFQLSDFSVLFLFFFLPMISQGYFSTISTETRTILCGSLKKMRVENKFIWNIYL